MFSLLVLYAECFGFFIEMATLTLMGALVHSNIAGKFLILLFFVVAYTTTCYKRVTNKYQKISAKIFAFIKSKLQTDIVEVVKQRQSKQAKTAFKYTHPDNDAAQQSHTRDYSEYDVTGPIEDGFVAMSDTLCMRVRSLVLFIDDRDVARIPVELFEQIINMRCTGMSGSIHRSMLRATRDLVAMILFLCFVLIVVMAFGDAYQITTTNQMLLAVAGGFLPFVFKELLKPDNPDLNLNSYTVDGRIDEILQDFCQVWPVSDIKLEGGAAP